MDYFTEEDYPYFDSEDLIILNKVINRLPPQHHESHWIADYLNGIYCKGISEDNLYNRIMDTYKFK
jgi:hypothetical protein